MVSCADNGLMFQVMLPRWIITFNLLYSSFTSHKATLSCKVQTLSGVGGVGQVPGGWVY
jgi:hypothetical protein